MDHQELSSKSSGSQSNCLHDYRVCDRLLCHQSRRSTYEGVHTEMKHIYKAPAVRASCICPAQTGMFTGIKSVPKMPTTTAAYVAEKITRVPYSEPDTGPCVFQTVIPMCFAGSAKTRLRPLSRRIRPQPGQSQLKSLIGRPLQGEQAFTLAT
ncbi:hypothetical protein AUP68_07746 [Ilyonectria robusta]